ncbi:MAG TPA: hypothetical protein PKK61_00175 [Defluviitaleaceae bacterium]|jgi:DNA-directed RNA polymerase subunit RPC12/RpoP|nr:hypothetical protein [Candidatus Epulonipiscium sp.]HOA79467.1 hypothetical protein [Defluviitaleaceae bacterium]
MLINEMQTIVFQCASCGSFCFDVISLFDFSGKKEQHIVCKCSQSSVRLTLVNKQIVISIPCFLCSQTHAYTYKINQFFSDTLKILQCPKKNMKIGFIGNDSQVRNALDSHENSLNEILKEMGISNLCNNIEVAIESINYIHDLAELGKINCECGSNKIEMDLLTNKVKLRCIYCGNEIFLLTRNNEDLKHLKSQSNIFLKSIQVY